MFNISPDTEALTDRLVKVPFDGQVTDAELSAVIGRDIRNSKRYLVQAALKRACNEHGAVFERIRSVGWRRLTVEEVHKIGHTARRRIRRTAGGAERKLTAVTIRANNISNEAQLKINRELSTLGLIKVQAKDRFLHKAEKLEKPEPVAKVAQQFLDELNK